VKFWNRDIYIAPNSRIDGSGDAELKKGQTGRIEGDQTLTFDHFQASGGVNARGMIDIGVALTYSDGKRQVPIQPHYMLRQTGEVTNPPVDLPGGAYRVQVAKVSPPNQENGFQPTVMLHIAPNNPVDVAAFEISSKPFVNVLWFGGYMMFFGGILTWRKRARVAARAGEKEQQPELSPDDTEPGSIRPKRRAGLRPEPATMFVSNE
jgi:hypothetical protein